ncbi:MAG: hypothetical protein JWQ09_4203 [Segetibacter sp.]|nr:hypothetical protein [Segetibacter sp.]
MPENNQGLNSQNDNELNSSVGKTSTSQLTGDTVSVQGTTFTKEEIEQANKPQPNVILDKASGPNTETTRDNERVNARANEASDSTDTNTGGMIAGAAKGANQS